MHVSPSSRLGHLVDLMRQRSATRVEVAELEELLQDEAMMEEYVHLMEMESMLVASFSNDGADTFDRLFPHPAHKPVLAGHSGWWLWGGMAAAIVLCFTGLWVIGQLAEHTGRPAASTATVDPAEQVEHPAAPVVSGWIGLSVEDQRTFVIGGGLPATDLSLASGVVEIRTPNGCQVVVQAPARFRVSSPDAVHLAYGKLTVESPDSSRTVKIHYGDGYHIWRGEHFAVSVPQESTGAPEITSIHGNLHIRSRQSEIVYSVGQHQSLRHLRDGTARTIPFAGDEFLRELPEPELAWTNTYDRDDRVAWVTPDDAEYSRIYAFGDGDERAYGIASPKVLTFDVDDLVWGPGEHRAILKWVNGPDAMSIERMQLFRNGELVGEDVHVGKTGSLSNTEDHIYQLTIPREDFQRGGWELRAKVRGIVRSNGDPPQFTEGVLYFGDRRGFAATQEDFMGDWRYQFDGRSFVRRISPDGTISLIVEGRKHATGRWWLKDGLLHATMNGTTEAHMLRDKHTLIFIDRPYNNAVREAGE